MAKKKTGRGRNSGSRSSSKGGRSSGSAGKGSPAKRGGAAKPKAARKSGGRSRRRPAAPAQEEQAPAPEAKPEGGDSGAPDGGSTGRSLEGMLPPSVARNELDVIGEKVEGLRPYFDSVITNNESHRTGYGLVKSYLDDHKTELQPEHETAVEGLVFRDGSDYATVLKQIVELNKLYQDAQDRDEGGDDKGDDSALEKVRQELEELKQKVEDDYRIFEWEHESYVQLLHDQEGIKAAYNKGKRAQTALANSTYFPRGGARGKARTKIENFTLATWYVKDSFAALESSNGSCEKLEGFIDRMKPLAGDAANPSE